MRSANRIRIATTDKVDAVDIACSEVEAAIGIPVRTELQEIEGPCLILELLLPEDGLRAASTSRLAAAIDQGALSVEVLSTWREPPSSTAVTPRPSDLVLTPPHFDLPAVAARALDDNLPTVQWERDQRSWHLAVPCTQAAQPTRIGLSRRKGYSVRFTSLEVAAIRMGLAS
jgi:hypothetical protein